jgi:FlaA1/EpsC-like NDP-sugar epimerase
MPLTYYFIGAVIQVILLLAVRFSFRFIQILKRRSETTEEGTKRIMLIGAGNAAQAILRELSRSEKVSDKVVCIIDDNLHDAITSDLEYYVPR